MEAHPLSRKRVRQVVPDGQPGFYRLGYIIGGRFYTTYVGRSDSCLQRRLIEHERYRWHEAFVARPTETVEEAYQQECLFYHLEGASTGNRIHPAKPAETSTECPYCLQETVVENNPATPTINNAD